MALLKRKRPQKQAKYDLREKKRMRIDDDYKFQNADDDLRSTQKNWDDKHQWLLSETNRMEAQKTELEAQKKQVEAQKTELEAQKKQVEALKKELEEEKKEVEAQKKELEEQKLELEARRDHMNQTWAIAQEELRSERAKVETDRTEVQSERNRLQEVNESKPESVKVTPSNPPQITIHDVPGEGNCLFNSVAYGFLKLLGQNPTNDEIRMVGVHMRQKCVEQLWKSQEDDFVRVTLECEEKGARDYCEHMAKSGSWGGDLEAKMLSKALNIRIEIAQEDKTKEGELLFMDLSPENFPSTIRVFYDPIKMHYYGVEP